MEEPKEKMDKTQISRPLRPILGGTKNGTRPQRYSYWRVGYAAKTVPTLPFWVTQAGEYHCEKQFLSGDFEHNQRHQFYYHLAGEAEICHPKGALTVSPGDLIVIRRGAKFGYHAPQGMRVHWFAVAGVFTHFDAEKNIARFPLGYQQSLETIFILLRETLILEQPGAALRAVALVYELLALLEAMQSPWQAPAVYPDTVRIALSYLYEHYRDPFVAENVAAACGISAPHLRFLFQKWVGETPHQSHTRYRIEMAERLLASQEMSVSEVGKQVGYQDPYYFSRVFKKLTGIQPSRYRGALAQGRENQSEG